MASEDVGKPALGGAEDLGEEGGEGVFGTAWDRRTFLKAAALGTAATAIWQKGDGLTLNPLSALADDLSTFQCTANDVRIVGPGQVLNEPCSCNGTFTAQVAFTVENNAASARGCITLHLCPAAGLPQTDVILQGTIPGKTTQTMTATINNYPCGAGLVCFGSPVADGRQRCDAGTCCSTVSWAVPGQDTCPPARQISSKCRHQQICIQGRGVTTVDCDTSTAGNQATCNVVCGSTATVRVCTSNAASLGPFTFTLSDGQSFGPTADTCHNFTTAAITSNTTLTATVTDDTGCAKSATVTLNTQAISASIDVAGDEACNNGVLTLTASAGTTCQTFTWKIDNMTPAAFLSGSGANDAAIATVNADGTLTFRSLDGDCHTITVDVACGGCNGSASTTVTQCVRTTTPCP